MTEAGKKERFFSIPGKKTLDKKDLLDYNIEAIQWPVGQAVKTTASHAVNGSSILPRVTIYALLAQLVEQLTLNQWVLGSSPRWCTKKSQQRKLLTLFFLLSLCITGKMD